MQYRLKINLALISIVIATIFLSAVAVTGVTLKSHSKKLKSSGRIKVVNVKVYWNEECTNNVGEIEWGALNPGDSVSKTIYVKHNSQFELTLRVFDSGWNPVEAGSYLDFSCDKDGVTIRKNEVCEAILRLQVPDDVSGFASFSFDITIEGTNN